MVSLGINSLSLWLGTNHTAEFGDNLPQGRQDIRPGPSRTSRMQAWANTRAVGRRSGIGAEYEAGLAQAKDGAGAGPAEEQTCARGRGTRLLKIRESRTRTRGRDDIFIAPRPPRGAQQ